MSHLDVHSLSGGYVPGQMAIEDVSFSAGPREIVAVLGPNGGGKSTLLRAILGELPVRSGQVTAVPSASVPQLDRTRLDFPVTALDVALMGAYGRTPWWRRIARADRAAAMAALERVDLAEQAAVLFGALSGGQRQRVLLARALVQEARVMILDEPFGGVDPASGERMDAILGELRGERRAIVVATHDVAAARTFDRVLCLNGRQVAFGEPGTTLSRAVLEATYGSEIVVLEEDGGPVRAVAVQHHEH